MAPLPAVCEDEIGGYLASRWSIQFYALVQSQHFDLSAWISLLTLCFAPLVAHILIGAPEPIVLGGHEPRWYQRSVHYNPTSIYWRYYAITIRGLSIENFSRDDIAATNAIFWHGGWDGSESIMVTCRGKGNDLSSRRRCPFFSVSMVKTLLVTIQGVQAAYDLGKGLSLGGYALSVSLPTIFQPLAIAGLFRLLASPWLTDDYRYATTKFMLEELRSQNELALTSPLEPQLPPHCTNKGPARVMKTFFLLSTTTLVVLAAYYIKPNPRITAGTTSTLLVNIFYLMFLLVTLITAFIYTIRGENDTTTIPCINSPWYAVYTWFLFVFALAVVIIAALETRQTSCDQWTTYPEKAGFDHWLCPT
jgi:hypothetical protein